MKGFHKISRFALVVAMALLSMSVFGTTDLRVELYDRSNAPEGGGTLLDNFIVNWVKAEVLKKLDINVIFVPIPRQQDDDKLAVLLAAGTAPDVSFSYDDGRFFNYAKNGGLTELTELIDKYGPNLKGFLSPEQLKVGSFNGKVYAVTGKRTVVSMHSTWIRKDWLDKLGLPLPKTTQEFYAALKAFKEKDPGNVGKDKVIPFGMHGLRFGTNYLNLLYSFQPTPTAEESYTLPNFAWRGSLDGLKFLNKMFSEGLISRDFAIDDTTKRFTEDAANGYVGAFITDTQLPLVNSADGILRNLERNVPGAKLVPVDTFRNPEGKYRKENYNPTGIRIFIPKSSKKSVEAIKYLDWMSQNITSILMGTLGVHHKVENGLPTVLDPAKYKKDLWAAGDVSMLSNTPVLASSDQNIRLYAQKFAPYVDLAEQAVKIGVTDGFTKPIFDRPIESEIKYRATLDRIAQELVVKCIVGRPQDVENIYNTVWKQYLSSGGQEVINEKLAAYRAMSR